METILSRLVLGAPRSSKSRRRRFDFCHRPKCSLIHRIHRVHSFLIIISIYPSSMHSPAASTCSLASTSAVDRVVILYASETGNAQDTAERVGREFRRRGRAVTLLSMDMFDIVSCPSLLQLQAAPS